MIKEDNRTVMEKTTVPWNAVAAIYQHLLFFYFLIDLNDNEEIGYEVKDDIHIDYKTKKETRLIQVKHTILTNAAGEPKNLTEKDNDLWHTISNWIDVINDKNDFRSEFQKQIDFISNVEFELLTNKQSQTNSFFLAVSDFIQGKTTIERFKEYLRNLLPKETKPKTPTLFDKLDDNKIVYSETDNAIKKLLDQKDLWISSFLNKISVNSLNDLKNKILEKLKNRYHVGLTEVIYEKTYESFNSELLHLIEQKGYNKEITITFNEYKNLISRCISKHINPPKYVVLQKDYNEICLSG